MFEIAEGRLLAGKYALVRPLARGGMGVVWVVRHVLLDIEMAAKFVGTSSPNARARFEREARSAAQLSGPHVVHTHDYGVEADTPYLVMELLRGEDLGSRLRRVVRLPPSEVSQILAHASRGLRRAHEAGIVHRDLKPGNVFIARDHDAEVVKLLDFGIAKITEAARTDEVTHSDQILGSVHYMSPEQVRSPGEVDHRADLWALAAIAYRCLTGEYPFPGGDAYSTIVSICDDPLLPPSRLTRGLTPEMDQFFERALAKDPAARFGTAADLAAAFAEVASGAPTGGEHFRGEHPAGELSVETKSGTESGPVTLDPLPLFSPGSRGIAEGAHRERGTAETREPGLSSELHPLAKRSRRLLALGPLAAVALGVMALGTAKRSAEPPPADAVMAATSAAASSREPQQRNAREAPEAAATAPPTSQQLESAPPVSLAPSARAVVPREPLGRPPNRSAPATPKPGPQGFEAPKPVPSASVPSAARVEPSWKPAATPL